MTCGWAPLLSSRIAHTVFTAPSGDIGIMMAEGWAIWDNTTLIRYNTSWAKTTPALSKWRWTHLSSTMMQSAHGGELSSLMKMAVRSFSTAKTRTYRLPILKD